MKEVLKGDMYQIHTRDYDIINDIAIKYNLDYVVTKYIYSNNTIRVFIERIDEYNKRKRVIFELEPSKEILIEILYCIVNHKEYEKDYKCGFDDEDIIRL